MTARQVGAVGLAVLLVVPPACSSHTGQAVPTPAITLHAPTRLLVNADSSFTLYQVLAPNTASPSYVAMYADAMGDHVVPDRFLVGAVEVDDPELGNLVPDAQTPGFRKMRIHGHDGAVGTVDHLTWATWVDGNARELSKVVHTWAVVGKGYSVHEVQSAARASHIDGKSARITLDARSVKNLHPVASAPVSGVSVDGAAMSVHLTYMPAGPPHPSQPKLITVSEVTASQLLLPLVGWQLADAAVRGTRGASGQTRLPRGEASQSVRTWMEGGQLITVVGSNVRDSDLDRFVATLRPTVLSLPQLAARAVVHVYR